ncbi:hypothetical protein PHYPSEUDO_002798 [Phytophthora pseudosyringae]|uniref:Uncharacterized protein n=1 Tax=Phytophthora pseudosyringae TaxID=221518 RepID=A0A8T1VW70_9STRA|nr:hypothetical protein PHYPSEUDO_002798 [Phytophthora pseudosyringae]
MPLALEAEASLRAFAEAKLPLDALGRVFSFAWTLREALAAELADVVAVLLATRDAPCAPGLADSVAASGQLHMLQILHRFRAEGFSTDAMDGAARGGHLDMVHFLHLNRSEGCTSRALDDALEAQHFKVVRFLVQHRPEKWSGRAARWAAENDDLQAVRDILGRNRDAPTAEAKVVAYKQKQTEMLKVLYEEGSDARPSYTLVYACADSDLEMAKYLTARGEGFVKSAMSEAIAAGSLEIVKHLHENAPPQRYTEASRVVPIQEAALKGQLKVVDFLIRNCPANCNIAHAVKLARQRKCQAVLDLLEPHMPA